MAKGFKVSEVHEETTVCGVTFGVWEGMIFPLTPCCKASGKGSTIGETGVVCRACYEPVSSYYGSADMVGTPEAVNLILVGVGQAGCPCPDSCATYTAHKVEVVEELRSFKTAPAEAAKWAKGGAGCEHL